jgi:hypothetical protein
MTMQSGGRSHARAHKLLEHAVDCSAQVAHNFEFAATSGAGGGCRQFTDIRNVPATQSRAKRHAHRVKSSNTACARVLVQLVAERLCSLSQLFFQLRCISLQPALFLHFLAQSNFEFSGASAAGAKFGGGSLGGSIKCVQRYTRVRAHTRKHTP